MDNRKISVIIVEREHQIRHDLRKALILDKAYNIISIAEDISGTDSILLSGKADVVIMNADNESLSYVNAQCVKHMNQNVQQCAQKDSCRPVIIVTVEANQQALARELLKSGADYFLVKPLNMNTVARHIKEIYFFKKLPPYSAYAAKESPGVLKFAVNHLNSVPIGSHLKGYHYLLTGIMALIKDETMKNNITKALYPYIAKKWQSTPVRVERAIRNAIATAWDNGGAENFKALYGKQKTYDSKPSNSKFMLMIADLYTCPGHRYTHER